MPRSVGLLVDSFSPHGRGATNTTCGCRCCQTCPRLFLILLSSRISEIPDAPRCRDLLMPDRKRRRDLKHRKTTSQNAPRAVIVRALQFIILYNYWQCSHHHLLILTVTFFRAKLFVGWLLNFYWSLRLLLLQLLILSAFVTSDPQWQPWESTRTSESSPKFR